MKKKIIFLHCQALTILCRGEKQRLISTRICRIQRDRLQPLKIKIYVEISSEKIKTQVIKSILTLHVTYFNHFVLDQELLYEILTLDSGK